MTPENDPQCKEPSSTDSELLDSPGANLRRARETAQLSLKEVADQLRLVSSQIKALEEDRYDYFKGEIFSKGYLRAYGKLMGMDLDYLMAAYNKLHSTNIAVIGNTRAKVYRVQSPSKASTIQYWSVALVLFVVVILWALSGGTNNKPSPSLLHDDSLLTVDKRDRSLLEALENQRKAQTVSVVQTLSEKAPLQEDDDVISTDVNGVVDTENHSVTGQGSVDTSVRSDIQNTQSVSDVLSFRFSADCWVKVTDSSEQVLVADLKRAGGELTLSGRSPFTVVLGFAPAVSLEYNGEAVSIKANRSNTANIVVGRL